MATTNKRRAIVLTLAIAIAVAAATVTIHQLWAAKGFERLIDSDIYNVWEEGKKLAAGKNPYARIIGESMRDNKNYPTYLPLSYLFVALLQKLGIREFPDFIRIWRLINLACHLGLGLLTFHIFNRQQKPISGLIACSILLLGRWSAYIIDVQHLEFPAILAIVAAGDQLRRRPPLSALLFGLSLCMKQIGILLLPCFLLALRAQTRATTPAPQPFKAWNYCLFALALPLLISLPFLIDHPTGFALNMLFSATRNSCDHGIATGSPMILMGVDKTRLLMLVLFLLNWLAQARERLDVWMASTLTLLIFLQFNPVVFAQYYIWFTAFLLISVAFLTPLPGQRRPQGLEA
jgi:uncharacterized membrane protein